MSTIRRFRRVAPFTVLLCVLFMGACATQKIDLSDIHQGMSDSGANLEHFKASDYSVYTLFDLVPIHKASVKEIVAEANPEGKPVTNLKVTSQEDGLASIVNILNGGAIDRGVLVSLNKVTVEGDIIK